MGIVDDLERARKAFEQRDWATAYDQLAVVADLGLEDLLKLATAAYLAGDNDVSVRALQRGYQVAVEGGDTLARSASPSCSVWSSAPAANRRWPAAGPPGLSGCSPTSPMWWNTATC